MNEIYIVPNMKDQTDLLLRLYKAGVSKENLEEIIRRKMYFFYKKAIYQGELSSDFGIHIRLGNRIDWCDKRFYDEMYSEVEKTFI